MAGPSFLDPARESEVNLRLNLARRTLLEMYHPDQSYGLEADYEKMTEKSKAVSEAFAELKTGKSGVKTMMYYMLTLQSTRG